MSLTIQKKNLYNFMFRVGVFDVSLQKSQVRVWVELSYLWVKVNLSFL